MQPALVSLAISALALGGLIVLFRVEKSKSKRFLETKRETFDRGIARLLAVSERVTIPLRRDTVRHSLHYFFHQMLRILKEALRALDTQLDALLRTNKALARKVGGESGSQTKLQAIADHKASTALSAEEQKTRKERSIGTQL